MTSTNEKGKRPLDLSRLSKSEFNREIQKGFDDFKHGQTFTAQESEKELKKSKLASAFNKSVLLLCPERS